MSLRFLNKICIVTGGASGIGKATCERVSYEGGTAIIIDINEEKGRESESEIISKGGKALFLKTDVSNSSQVKNAVKQVAETYSKIDILVNNAAMMTFKTILELSEEEWDKLMAVNLKSVFLFSKFCIPHMEGGSIVNISSVHAFGTTSNVIPYATSKGGIEAFTRGVSREYDINKVRVNCVDPGAVDTPMLWDNPNIKSGKEKIEGIIGKPEDIASAICYLASDEARYINGATLTVDGGRLNIL